MFVKVTGFWKLQNHYSFLRNILIQHSAILIHMRFWFLFAEENVCLSQVLLDMMNELQQECHIAGFSETTNNAIFQYALTGVKDKLVEDQR